jgi:2-polyprenyl-6-methoxyphenol hydroxylase-like FAD-dependent oxidoreductase
MAITRHGKQPLSFLHLLHVKYLPPSHSLTASSPLSSTAQEALPTWYKGRTILIGDAAHSMLPLQGQGASQSIEDAEALGHFFRDINVGTSEPADPVAMEDVTRRLEQVFEARYERASLIQQYSRQAGKPATEAGSNVITMYVCHDYHCWQPTSLLGALH